MQADRIVVTGVGLISSVGNDPQTFWNSLEKGVTGIRPITLFPTANYPNKSAGEIPDFDPRLFLGTTGFRHFDRTSLLLASVTKLALEDGARYGNDQDPSRIGIVTGSTFGSISSIVDFDSESVREGPAYVNPMDFPNTVLNAPASRASIMFHIKGICGTVSTGETSSLDALIYACDFLRLGRAEAILAGGCYGLTEGIFGAFSRVGALSGSNPDREEISAPFDKRRNGIVLGEGSCLLLLETLESANRRNATLYGEIRGYGTAFTPLGSDKIKGPKKAIQQALHDASLSEEDIDCIFAGANSTEEGDRSESQLIQESFGTHAKRIPVTAIKSVIGECLDATGALQAAAGLMALKNQIVPPTLNYQVPDPTCDLDYVPNLCRQVPIKNILLSAFSPTGHNTFVILSATAQLN